MQCLASSRWPWLSHVCFGDISLFSQTQPTQGPVSPAAIIHALIILSFPCLTASWSWCSQAEFIDSSCLSRLPTFCCVVVSHHGVFSCACLPLCCRHNIRLVRASLDDVVQHGSVTDNGKLVMWETGCNLCIFIWWCFRLRSGVHAIPVLSMVFSIWALCKDEMHILFSQGT